MELFSTRGYLNRGHVGGIAFTYNIPEDFESLSVELSFNKREVTAVTPEIREETRIAFENNFGGLVTNEMIDNSIRRMKAEINMSLFINEEFIGCAHRDDENKRIMLTKEEASLGFKPITSLKGVIKIVLNVISIVDDETEYKLSVKVGEVE